MATVVSTEASTYVLDERIDSSVDDFYGKIKDTAHVFLMRALGLPLPKDIEFDDGSSLDFKGRPIVFEPGQPGKPLKFLELMGDRLQAVYIKRDGNVIGCSVEPVSDFIMGPDNDGFDGLQEAVDTALRRA